jgi:hypothetical protein
MTTNSHDLRRALAKRGPSSEGWRWVRKPTARELEAFRAFCRRFPR